MQKEKELLAAALEYAAAGMPVVPLHSIRNSRCTCGDKNCPAPGKHPRTQNGLKDATTDAAVIKKWWSSSKWPNASIAGIGGTFLCLDVDSKSGGLDSLEELIADNAQLPDTAVALTGEYPEGRGRHYWFRMPDEIQLASKVGVRTGIDIRCARGYAVMPPSPHVSGVDYEWVVPFEEISEAPDWVLDLAPVATPGESSWEPIKGFRMSKDTKAFLSGDMDIPIGEQRLFLCKAARSVLTTGKTVDETTDMLWEGLSGMEQEEDRPWLYEDILYLVEDIFRSPPSSALESDQKNTSWEDHQERNDLANANRLVATYDPGHLIYVPEFGCWFIFEDGQWRRDDGTQLTLRWEEETKKMFAEAASKDKPAEWALFVKGSLNISRIDAAINLTKRLVAVRAEELDADPFLLNCENGVLDLRTGELLEPDPRYLLTKKVHAAYDPKAKSKLWDQVVKSIMPDEDLREFVQKVFGYALTGSVDEHKFFYLHGPPASGKTTLLEAFSTLMGSYSVTSDPQVFLQQGQGESGPSVELARLVNRRVVVTHEVEEGARWAEAKISRLTGGDSITARFLYKDLFDFKPQFKLFFTANHKPRVGGSGRSGIWRRIIIIPIERVIPMEERDPTVQFRLQQKEAREAILAWAVEGALRWMDDRQAGTYMEVPMIVQNEVETYKVEADHVLEFLREMVVKLEGDDLKQWVEDERILANKEGRKAAGFPRVARSDVFELYIGWCKEAGRRNVLTRTSFNRRLLEAGYECKAAQTLDRRKKTTECWVNCLVKSPIKVKN